MGTNESVDSTAVPLDQRSAANLGNYNPAVHQLNPPTQGRNLNTNEGIYNVNNSGAVFGQQKLNPSYLPTMQPPVFSHHINSPMYPDFPSNNVIGPSSAYPRGIGEMGGSLSRTANNVVKREKIDKGRQNERKELKQVLQNAQMNLSPANLAVTQYDPGLYNNRYPIDVKQGPYVHTSPQVYSRGYPTENVSPNAYGWIEPSNTSYYQEAGGLVFPYQQYNGASTVGVYNNSNTAVSTEPWDPAEEKRKLALKNLLIRPIVQMKGEAWDDNEWNDFNSFRSFPAACTDFLRIIELTKDSTMAAEIKEFLTSDLLTPRYVARNNPPENGKKLNHFHVFWNFMHQLPFAVKRWDTATSRKLKLFYEVWVRITLQCGYCRGHYITWVGKYPPPVTDRESLNHWLFRLHNDVNLRSSKPQFEWSTYKQRWGPNEHKTPEKRKRIESKKSTPQYSTPQHRAPQNRTPHHSSSSMYSTPKKSTTLRVIAPQQSGSRNSSYGSVSKTSKSGGSPYTYIGVTGTPRTPRLSPSPQQEKLSGTKVLRTPNTEKKKPSPSEPSSASIEATVRELTGLGIEEELATLKLYKPTRQAHYVVTPPGPETCLPRRCLSRKKLLLRRNRVKKHKGPYLPRKRVSRRGRGFKINVSPNNNRNKERNV